jgi:uncharacterized alkaline shock family protein YloU
MAASTATAQKATSPEAPAPPETGNGLAARRGSVPAGHASLTTEQGQTRIADGVVAKIAGMAAREIPGVHSMGRGLARRMGQLRALVPGQSETSMVTQGVSVEVGEREAAIDLDIVTWYGQSIVEITDAVRRNVLDRVEGMTGLKVVEVNINVDDIYVEGEDEEPAAQRVQ